MPIIHAVFSFDQRSLFPFAVSSSKHRPKDNFILVYSDSGNNQKSWENMSVRIYVKRQQDAIFWAR